MRSVSQHADILKNLRLRDAVDVKSRSSYICLYITAKHGEVDECRTDFGNKPNGFPSSPRESPGLPRRGAKFPDRGV